MHRRNLLRRHLNPTVKKLGLPATVDFRSFRTMHSSLMSSVGVRPVITWAAARPVNVNPFAEPFRFEPEPVRVRAYPSLSIPSQFVVRAVRAAFKLVNQRVDEDLVVPNWRFQIGRRGRTFAGRFRR
jgi:hypothetical protein